MPAPFRNVVIGVDASPASRRAVAFVAGMRPASRATLVQVVEPVHPLSLGLLPARVREVLAGQAAALEAARRRRAARDLVAAATRLRRDGWRVRSVVRTGVPIEELLAAATTARADLLAVGARGRTGMARVLLGSVAEGVLKRSRVPTLIAR